MRRHLVAVICSGVMIFLSGLIIGLWIQDWLDVDSCLDRGGRWDYPLETCVYK
jgi:hypothetical protein